MNRKRLVLILLVVLLAISLTACGDNNDEPASNGDEGSVSKDVQDLLDIAVPNLEAKLEEGKVSQEVMDDIISQIKNGEISNKIQLMSKMAPYL